MCRGFQRAWERSPECWPGVGKVTEKSQKLRGEQKLLGPIAGKRMQGIFEIQRGEQGVLENQKSAYDWSTECLGEV